MNTVKNAKIEASNIIDNAVELRIEELKTTMQFTELKNQIERFEYDPYCKGSDRRFGEDGLLESVMELRLDYFSEEEFEVIEELLRECSEVVYFYQDQYSQGKHEWSMSQCLGEAITVNFSDRRNCYAVHSGELKLKLNYSDLIGNDDSEKLYHAKLIIEKTMRQQGIFPNIVEIDYYGGIIREIPMLGTLDDTEIDRQLEKIEKVMEE